VQKIEATIITIDRKTGEITTKLGLTATACQVTGDIIDGDLVNVGCVSKSCDGECNLQSEEEGSTTKYWCTCD
jgi:hypothetical protein